MAGLLEQLRNAVSPLQAEPVPPGLRPAAVLLIVDPRIPSLPIFFVLRSDRVSQHPSQIGLPGGGIEEGETPADAALREAGEEVGLPANGVEILGQLTPFNTEVSSRWVTPLVGLLKQDWDIRADDYEVAEWFWLPLEQIIAAPHSINELERDGTKRHVHFYEVENRIVWGVTGAIVADLLRRMGY